MHDSKLLVSAARLLRQAWRQAAQRACQQLDTSLDRLDQNHFAIQQARRRLDRARHSVQSAPSPNLVRDLTNRLQHLRTASDEVGEFLKQTPMVAPAGKFLLAELRQLDADFDGLIFDVEQKLISTQTERVVLEDLDLGPFAIRFFWNRLLISTDYLCFDIVALDPNPAGADENTTHPHVKHEKVCAGDATTPIKLALEQGRLADAFSLVKGVLMTYNSHSPFVALEDWEGSACEACDSHVSSDDLRYCESCDMHFCSECTSCCEACGSARCLGCIQRCAVCEEPHCSGCLEVLEVSRRRCCSNCRCNCSACLENFPTDEKEEGSELCPLCRSRRSTVIEDPSEVPSIQPTPSSSESTYAQFQESCYVAEAAL